MLASIILLSILIILHRVFKEKKSKNSYQKKEVKVPDYWQNILEEHVLFYKNLNKDDKLHFKKRLQSFLQHVKIKAVDFKLDELDILLVASSAIIPVFGFDSWNYPNIKEVIIYPNYFNENLDFHKKAKNRNIGGLVGNGRFDNKMILSRKALHHGFSNKTDKGNTGIHEFVHLLDKLDGDIDGVPKILLCNTCMESWLDLVYKKMEAINNNKSDIRNYGGVSKEEFFAVASEYFFERPMLLKRKHPDLYKMLEDCFSNR